MPNTNVTLVWRCKTAQGWRRYPALFAKNGRPRTGLVKVDGREMHVPIGTFELRYYDGRRQMFKKAGDNPTDALHARNRLADRLAAEASAEKAGLKLEPDAPARKSLLSMFRSFIEDVEGRGKLEASQVYKLAGREFIQCIGKTFVDEIDRDDLTRYQRRLRNQGYSDRTIYNRHTNVCAFLLWLGLDLKKLAPIRPQYEEKIPEAYTVAETSAFFASIKDARLALTFELLLKTGLREQEAMYLEWTAIDFERGKLRVRGNRQYGFKVKDKEQRDVPIEAGLLERLREARKKNPLQRLVTGTNADKPHTHLLRILKRLANRAKLQCGACPGCLRKVNPECERWYLHKFRSTYITRLLREGMTKSTRDCEFRPLAVIF